LRKKITRRDQTHQLRWANVSGPYKKVTCIGLQMTNDIIFMFNFRPLKRCLKISSEFFLFKNYFSIYFYLKTFNKHPYNINKLIYQLKTLQNWLKNTKSKLKKILFYLNLLFFGKIIGKKHLNWTFYYWESVDTK
jgi:hypothetical protein